MIVLVVHFTVKPGTEEQARKYIRHMEEHTRLEPGCLMYIGHESIENPGHFCFYEQYVNRAALDAHRDSDHFKQYIAGGLTKIIETRRAELFELVSGDN